MTHTIKLNIEFCDPVESGDKPFEIRLNDRGYQKGDRIKFIPVKGAMAVYTPHQIELSTYEITYVINGYGLKENYVVFGIKKVNV